PLVIWRYPHVMDCTEHDTRVLAKLTALEATLQGTADLLRTVVTLLEHRTGPQSPAPEAAQPTIATYEDMYGPVEPAPEPVETRNALSTPPGRLRRWLFTE